MTVRSRPRRRHSPGVDARLDSLLGFVLQRIKSRKHFYFEADTGDVAMRDLCDMESNFQDLLKGDASELCPATAPLGIKPKGLAMKRLCFNEGHNITILLGNTSQERNTTRCISVLARRHQTTVTVVPMAPQHVNVRSTRKNQKELVYTVC